MNSTCSRSGGALLACGTVKEDVSFSVPSYKVQDGRKVKSFSLFLTGLVVT